MLEVWGGTGSKRLMARGFISNLANPWSSMPRTPSLSKPPVAAATGRFPANPLHHTTRQRQERVHVEQHHAARTTFAQSETLFAVFPAAFGSGSDLSIALPAPEF